MLLALLLLGAAAGAYTSLRLAPYSELAPKHVYMQHRIRHEGSKVLEEQWDISATDSVSPAVVLAGLSKGISWSRSLPSSWQVTALELRRAQFALR